MEMSDEEGENKQKGNRVLVDVRSQGDRDMRVPNMPPAPPPVITSHHAVDMDMRMIQPGGPMNPNMVIL